MPATTVEELSDWIAIRELTAAYNRAFDDVRSDDFAAVFTEDGTIEWGDSVHSGRDALRGMSAETGYGYVHVTTDPVIEIDGDRARQVCTILVYSRREDRSVNEFMMSGRYSDELVRTDQGWRFSRRSISLDREA